MTPTVTHSRLRALRQLLARRRGQALFSAIVVGALVLAMTITLANLSVNSVVLAGDMRNGEVLLQAARTGLAQTKLKVWDEALAPGQTSPGTPNQYRAYLAGIGLPDSADTASPTVDFGTLVGPDSVSVTRTGYRYDDTASSTTYVVLTSVATSPKGGRRQADVVLRVGGTPFDGFRFALLANNVNCIMCHAKFDNVKRRYNTNAALNGSFERVKVAALETLLLRTSPESSIAGTLYINGELTDTNGATLTLPPQNSGGMLAEDMDAFGRIIDPSNLVNMAAQADLVNNSTGASTPDGVPDPVAGGNFYKNYPTDPTKQFDGPLPSKFPPVVEDTDGNRLIDNTEWAAKAGSYTGHLQGGVISAFAPGAKYTLANTTTDSVPASGNTATLANNQQKNVILVGTAANPIDLSGGDVAIDGDVVISGFVKGSGTILARGNIYLLDDVQYADGVDTNGDGQPDGGTVFTGAAGQVRTFGIAPDGTQNTLAYTAVGNIVHGAYNLDKFGRLQDDTIPGTTLGYNSGTPSVTTKDGNGFIVDEESIFNRMEWTRSQPYIDAAGYPTDNAAFSATHNNAYAGTYLANNTADPATKPIPRYYTMQQGQNSAIRYDPPTAVWDNQEKVWKDSEQYDFDANGNPAAYKTISLPPGQEGVQYVTRPMNPKDDWISQEDLAYLYKNKNDARPAGPFKIDGLLYTDNAVMMMAMPDNRWIGSSDGEAEVNGSIVSADAGILVVNNDGGNDSSFNATTGGGGNTYTYDEASTANSTISEAQMGIDINGDGDKSDNITEAAIYANATGSNSWGWAGRITGSTLAGTYQLDLNKNGSLSTISHFVPNTLTSGTSGSSSLGLRVYYDDRTRNYLRIQDSSKAGIYVVARREH